MSCNRSRLAPALITLALALAGPALAQTPASPDKPMPAPQAPQSAPPVQDPLPPNLQQQPGDAFGQEITLPLRTIVYLKGHSNWDAALDTLVDAFKSLNEYLDKQGIKAVGPSMTIYTQTDDTGFQFEAAVPIAESPKDPPKGDIAIGQTPTGKALKFVHRGSYDAMDSTYEAITNYLDDKRLEARDLFIEEYASTPLTADSDKLVINVFVPIK